MSNPFNNSNTNGRVPYFKVSVNRAAGEAHPFIIVNPKFRVNAGRELPFDPIDQYSLWIPSINAMPSLINPTPFGMPNAVAGYLKNLRSNGLTDVARQVKDSKLANCFVIDLEPEEGDGPQLCKWSMPSNVGSKLFDAIERKRKYDAPGYWDLDACRIFGWDRYKKGAKHEFSIDILSANPKPALDIFIDHGGSAAQWKEIVEQIESTDLNHFVAVETEDTQIEWVEAVLGLDGKGQRDPLRDENFRNLARERRHARDDKRKADGLPFYNHLHILPMTFADNDGEVEAPNLDKNQLASLRAAALASCTPDL